jgi:hypothetical protein
MSEYKGFNIERITWGKYGTSYRYKCGKFIAPRKKDVTDHIDRLLDKQFFLDFDLKKLEKSNVTIHLDPDCLISGKHFKVTFVSANKIIVTGLPFVLKASDIIFIEVNKRIYFNGNCFPEIDISSNLITFFNFIDLKISDEINISIKGVSDN